MRERGHLEKTRPDGVRLATKPFRDLVDDIIVEAVPSKFSEDQRLVLSNIVTTTLMAHCHGMANGVIDTAPERLADELSAFILRGLLN